MKLMHIALVAAMFVGIAKADEHCGGAGRCCRCKYDGHYDNAQTNCVYYAVKARGWDDNGDGVLFCKFEGSQSDIAGYCHGWVSGKCNGGDHNRRGYDCWDC